MTWTVALMIAVSYWGARDVQTPCHPDPIRLTGAQMASYDQRDGHDAYMRADVGGCEVLLSPQAAQDRRSLPPLYCQGVVHEVGHIAGLEDTHRGRGVMRVGAFGHVPWGCIHPRKWLHRHGYALRGHR